MGRLLSSVAILLGLAGGPSVAQSIENASADDAPEASPAPLLPAPLAISPREPAAPANVQWGPVLGQALGFLFFEEGFRYATEEGSRHSHLPLVAGYADSVTNLHGWADGDPFYVNYVGHPMQGAVSGFIWIQNDLRYRDVVIGKDPHYWKGRLRAAAFSFVYSELTEIGPVSEASIGATQAFYPQQGFVDHVVTPSIGLVWIMAEDTVDKYIVTAIERRVSNPYIKALLRGGLNPSRSLANVFAGKVPWNRYTRPGVFEQRGPLRVKERPPSAPEFFPDVAPFEFTPFTTAEMDPATHGPCIGGGANAALRIRRDLQLVLEVAGCKRNGLPQNVSGDSLRFLAGPRWTPFPSSRWSPFAEVLAGGRKTTEEQVFPQERAALENSLQPGQEINNSDHALYTSTRDHAGFAIQAGVGVDMKLNNAFALRLVTVDYTLGWGGLTNGGQPSHGLQITTGLVLRMGTW